MQDKKPKSFGSKLEAFFAGKGFYIVLLLCVSVIGVSAWSMLNGKEEGKGKEADGFDAAVSAAGMVDGKDYTTFQDGIPAVAGTTPPLSQNAGISTPLPTAAPTAAPSPRTDTGPSPSPADSPLSLHPETSPAQPVSGPAQVSSKEGNAPDTAVSAAAVRTDYFVWPVIGEEINGYAMTSLQYDRTMRDWRTHDGIDVAAPLGTRVRAAGGGIVAEVLEDSGYGVTVVLDHGDGLCSVYANLAGTPAVSAGDAVSVGQVIGSVGSTALCEIGEVSHLHFAMTLNGESADPGDYLP